MLASWAPKNPYFAIVTDGNVISCHDCAKNEFLRKISLSFHISTSYRSIEYILTRNTGVRTSKRKRRKVQAKNDVPVSYIIGGSGQGHIFVFQEDGTLLKEIEVGVSSEIKSIEFVAPHEILVVVGSRSVMLVSQIFNSSVTSEIRNIREFEQPSESSSLEDEDSSANISSQNRSISTMKLSEDGKHVAVSFEGELCIFEYSSRNMVKSFPAFPTGSSFVHWLGEDHVLIGCKVDRYFYVHNILDDDDDNEKDILFSVPSNPVSVDTKMVTDKRRTKLFYVSIVTEEGIVYVYTIEMSKIRRKVTVKCESASKVRCVIENMDHARQEKQKGGKSMKKKKRRTQKFINCRFVDYEEVDSSKVSIDLVTGTIYNPQFHRLSIPFRNTKEKYTISVEADEDREEEDIDEEFRTGKMKKGGGELPTVMGQVNMNTPLSRFQSSIVSPQQEKMLDEDDVSEDDDSESQDEEEEEDETIEIVKESTLTLPDGPEDEDEEVGTDASLPISSSSLDLAQTLCTALKFRDYPQIRRLIDTIGEKNDGAISSVIKSCPSSPNAIQLLEFFITSIKQRQSDEETLSDLTTSFRVKRRRRVTDIKWMKYLFLHHSRYLLKRGDLSDFLSPLYHHLSAQISLFSLLTDVSGRLDLLLSLGGYSQISSSSDQLNQEKMGIRNEDVLSMMFGDDEEDEEETEEGQGLVDVQIDGRKVMDEDEDEEEGEDNDDKRLGFLMGLNENEIDVLRNAKIPNSAADDDDDDENERDGEAFEMEDDDMDHLKELVGGSDEEKDADGGKDDEDFRMDLGED